MKHFAVPEFWFIEVSNDKCCSHELWHTFTTDGGCEDQLPHQPADGTWRGRGAPRLCAWCRSSGYPQSHTGHSTLRSQTRSLHCLWQKGGDTNVQHAGSHATRNKNQHQSHVMGEEPCLLHHRRLCQNSLVTHKRFMESWWRLLFTPLK